MTDGPTPGLIVYEDRPSGRAVYLHVDITGKAAGYNGHVDLGTGIETALAQIVAEELDLPLSAVSIVLGDTARVPDQGPTIASETIQIASIPLRIAAAQARRWLVRKAALRLNVGENDIVCRQGAVCVGDTDHPYASLLTEEAVALALDRSTPVKDPKDYRIVGQKTGRRDLETKLRGTHPYVHDLDIDGMVHGHVIRPPYAGRDSGDFIGRSLLGFDADAVSAMPGFIAIVHEGDFLGVVADRADLAQAIAERLPVRWQMPPDLPDMTDLPRTIRDQPSTARRLDSSGDFRKGIADCDLVRERTYIWPYHEHGSIGPSCAVADWNDGQPTVWSGTQNPHMLRDDLSLLTGVAPEAIEIRRYQVAGCYGRNCADDVCGDALLLSRAVAKPVRVQLTRAQEHLWEPKGAAQIMDVRGGLKDAALHAYSLDTWYPSNRGPNLGLLLTGRIRPEPRPSDMGDRTIVPPYRVPHKAITIHDMAPIVRASWMRGVSALPNTFAHESFIDEMAFEAGEDPVDFRLKHLDDARQAELVRRTADAAGWRTRRAPTLRREGRMAFGQGFAFATYVHGTFPGVAAAAAAWVVDVTVDTQTGEVTLQRVFVGQDQGLVINPDGVRQQIHGNVIQTASRVLVEDLTFDAIAPSPRSWAGYPIQTFPAVPDIETMLIARPNDPPLGVGESAAVPSAAAIANAIFDATGVRLRDVPFTPERVRAALSPPAASPNLAASTTPSRGRPRTWALGGAIVSALTVAAISLPWHRTLPTQTPPSPVSFSQATLERGRQVFALGNCTTCHTADGGVANAGGRPIETPFGTVWTSNITSDPQTGLGQWSYEAFDRAMRQGISRDGHNLYPAFPYTSFARILPQDMYALYAYLQTLAPVRKVTPTAQMTVPFNLRPGLTLWNALYHDGTLFEPQQDRSAQWNRGRYLVEAAGHCSACHAPRNLLGAEAKNLTGASIRGWYAPPLEGDMMAQRGWTERALFDYLSKGHSTVATTAGPMADVVANLRTIPEADVRAMAHYLSDIAGSRPSPDALAGTETRPDAATTEETLAPDRASRIFESACAVCHEPAQAALVNAAKLSLTSSAVLRAPTPEAFRTLLAEGVRAPDGLDLGDMPSFAGELTQSDQTALAHYLRRRFLPGLAPWK